MTVILALAFLLQDEHPLSKDKTGLDWVLPFTEAQKKSENEKRILLIKPVAFGTSRDGGW